MTVRLNPITGTPILFAPDRAARPRAFSQEAVERCPFCPGNEADTPPAIEEIGSPWRARVFPNKYPPANGAEVIVESPDHDATFDAIENVTELMQLYVDRYVAHREAPHVALFKNEGPRAGSSIPHVHSQVVPLPFVPPRIAAEVEGFERASVCPLCHLEGAMIRETEHFRWIAPAASSMPYQQWLIPRRHVSEMSAFTEAEVEDAAVLLRDSSRTMLRLSESYNWLFLNFRAAPTAHTHIELFPRMAQIAGLELSTGTFVEIIDPVAAAARLRNTE